MKLEWAYSGVALGGLSWHLKSIIQGNEERTDPTVVDDGNLIPKLFDTENHYQLLLSSFSAVNLRSANESDFHFHT